jgi:hypothetical protein
LFVCSAIAQPTLGLGRVILSGLFVGDKQGQITAERQSQSFGPAPQQIQVASALLSFKMQKLQGTDGVACYD